VVCVVPIIRTHGLARATGVVRKALEQLCGEGGAPPTRQTPPKDDGTTGQGTVRKYGTTDSGKQRCQCNTRRCTLTETKGTPSYPRRTGEKDVIEVLVMSAEGSGSGALHGPKGSKKIPSWWMREAAQHVGAVEEGCCVPTRSARRRLTGCGPMWYTKVKRRGRPRRVLALHPD
jgi:hypothetical protein